MKFSTACFLWMAMVLVGCASLHPAIDISPESKAFNTTYVDNPASAKTIEFDGEEFSVKSSQETDIMYGLEFLKQGETFDNWTEMVTVTQLKTYRKPEEWLKAYVEMTKAKRISNARLLTNDKGEHKEYVVDQMLADKATDTLEHVLYLIRDTGSSILTIAHSRQIKLSDLQKDASLLDSVFNNKKNGWLDELVGLDYQIFAPEDSAN